jgi:hypothetical protein
MPVLSEQAPTTAPSKASLDRMADLTRRIVAVKKSELQSPRKAKRKLIK